MAGVVLYLLHCPGHGRRGNCRGVEQPEARWAHNPKVAGSSPAPATTEKARIQTILAFSYKGRVFPPEGRCAPARLSVKRFGRVKEICVSVAEVGRPKRRGRVNYCEHCRMLCAGTSCDACGRNGLRAAKDEDFCFLTEADTMTCGMLETCLKQENIPFAAIPCGTGVRTAFGMHLENRKIYVPFAAYRQASEITDTFSRDLTDVWRRELLDNIGKWHADARTEKKIRKKRKLPKEQSLLILCKEMVRRAQRIEDAGRISGCVSGGHYLFVYADTTVVIFNSVTYEILAVNETGR